MNDEQGDDKKTEQNSSTINSMAEAKQGTKLCSKCGKNPRGYPGTRNPWCKQCLATYKGGYDETKLAMERGRAFAAGVEAALHSVAMEFARLRHAVMTGEEIAFAIQQSPRPQYQGVSTSQVSGSVLGK